MLKKDVIEIVSKQFKLETFERKEKLFSDIAQFKSQMSAHGTFLSSMTIRGIADLCCEAIKNRSILLWETLYRAITTSGITFSEDLGGELKEIVNTHLQESTKEIKNIFQTQVPKMEPAGLLTPFEAKLEQAYSISLQKIHAEIDLFLQSLKAKEKLSEEKTGSYVFHFYSPVGAIQTGDNATTNVTQNIDGEGREQLLNALKMVEEAILRVDALRNYPKEEIIEIIKEGQSEIEKDKPNRTKLGSLLSTIAISIQTAGSIKPAYEFLKQVALNYLGIALP